MDPGSLTNALQNRAKPCFWAALCPGWAQQVAQEVAVGEGRCRVIFLSEEGTELQASLGHLIVKLTLQAPRRLAKVGGSWQALVL